MTLKEWVLLAGICQDLYPRLHELLVGGRELVHPVWGGQAEGVNLERDIVRNLVIKHENLNTT